MASDQGNISPFPDILASKEEKATPDYGLKEAKAIWGVHVANITTYNEQRGRDIINRQYAEGLQSVEKMKSWKGVSNTAYLNLDFSPINIIATTVDNIVGKLMNTSYKIQCNAIDPESKSKFDDYRSNLYADMFLKPFSDEMEQKTGIPLVAKNKEVPANDDEAELHLQMNYKEDAAIAMEDAFNYIFSSNSFDTHREEVLKDLIVIKRAAILRYYDEDWNIKVERVDPVDVITPYSKYADHRNDPYGALVKNYTIGQIATMANFTDKEIYDIAKSNAGKNNNPLWTWWTSYEGYYNSGLTGVRPWYNFNIQVLNFYFLGLDQKAVEFKEVKRRKFANNVTSNYESENPNAEVIYRKEQNVYQGQWVIGTDYIFNYKRENNIPREKINGSYSTKATLPLKIIAPGIYDMKNKSHVERMIPHEDAINLANLAMQTLMLKMKPPGVAIDVQGVMDAVKGMGLKDPLEIPKMYEATGNYVYSSKDDEGNSINSKVITELRGGLSDAMEQLIRKHQFERNLINEVIGYNTAVDASSPDANALVGVQNNAIQATNNSLRPTFNAYLKLITDTAKDLALMVQDCIEYDNEAFMGAIGTQATKTLAYGKKLAFVQLGIKIELLPDEQEKGEINQLIQIGVANMQLTPSDVIRIRHVMKENVKLAAKLLVYLEGKNRKAKMEESAALQKQNGDIQVQSSQAAAQATAQLDQTLTANKIAIITKESELKDFNDEKAFQRAMQLQSLKNEGLYTVAEINNGGKVDVQKAANDGKIIAQHVANEGKIDNTHHEADRQYHQTILEAAVAPEPKTPAKK